MNRKEAGSGTIITMKLHAASANCDRLTVGDFVVSFLLFPFQDSLFLFLFSYFLSFFHRNTMPYYIWFTTAKPGCGIFGTGQFIQRESADVVCWPMYVYMSIESISIIFVRPIFLCFGDCPSATVCVLPPPPFFTYVDTS